MEKQIKEKLEQLKDLGKDDDEFKLWAGLLPVMTEEEKMGLLKSLDDEIKFITRN